MYVLFLPYENKYNKKNPVFYLPSTDNKIMKYMRIIRIDCVWGRRRRRRRGREREEESASQTSMIG